MTSVRLVLCLAIVGSSACGHSDPVAEVPAEPQEPFRPGLPTQLTYSPGLDGFATVSADGQWLHYRYARGTGDRDFCAGVLPAGGGHRVESICNWNLDDAARADDFRSLVRIGDDQMAFTWHASGTGNASPLVAGLYVAPLGRVRESRLVLPLLGRPAGASANYTYLLDPVWEGGTTLLALASGAYIGPTVAFGPVDTTYRGIELVRIDITSTPATIDVLAPASDAVAWMLDAESDMAYYQRRFYSTPPGSGAFSIIADTVYRVPLAGGAATPVFGWVPEPGWSEQEVDGFAVVDGRVFVAMHRSRPIPQSNPLQFEHRAEIAEVQGDGSLVVRVSRNTGTGDRWGRLTGAQDGLHLIAESFLGGQWDLYRYRVVP